jgi:GNAT superfamily N-acetyltransferase
MMSPSAYRPGVIGEIVRLHGEYYARQWRFGSAFEAKVAVELGAFVRDFREGTDFFAAHYDEAGLVGTVSLEAPHGQEMMAHLRWFITHERARGSGLGRRLLEDAMRHADDREFRATYLTTFAGLDAARHLYESVGFRLVAETQKDQWSGGVGEQRYERKLRA